MSIFRVEFGLDTGLQALVAKALGCYIESSGQGGEIREALRRIELSLKEIKMTNDELKTLLTNVDSITNSIAANVQSIADVDQKISDEMDVLIANPANQLTPEVSAQLQGFADRLQATSTASAAQIAVLQAIAAKGAPVVPPPPPTPSVG